MQAVRELTVPQMARRVVRYIPELDFSFVCFYLRQNLGYGLRETDVSGWLRVFDSLVIDKEWKK